MEQIVVGLNRPHFARPISHFSKSHPRIFITLLLVISFFTAVLVVNTLAKRLGEPYLPDPFAAFTDFFPGQRLDSHMLEAEGFLCYGDMLPSPADITERCVRTLPSGMFSAINLTISDGVIKWLDLKVRENNLNVGDLSLRWGNPEIRVYGIWVNLSWPNRHIIAWGWSSNGRFTYFQALSHITFAV